MSDLTPFWSLPTESYGESDSLSRNTPSATEEAPLPAVKWLQCRNETESETLDRVKGSEILAAVESERKQGWSSDTDESQDSSPDAKSRMLLIYSKHQLMVRIMQEVYTIFDKQWSAASSTRAGSETSGCSPSGHQQDSPSASRSSQKQPQRRKRDEQDPDDDRARQRRRSDRPATPKAGEKAYACPFHQKDPVKYSCNSFTGLKYRACTGPGFENISRLKYVFGARCLILTV